MNKNIIGLIIAGGRGSRMKTNIPKPFVILNNKPIIWYSFNLLNELGIDNQFVSIPAKDNEFFIKEISKINSKAKCIPDNVPIRGNVAGLISTLPNIPEHIDHIIVLHPDSSCFVSIDTILPALEKHLAQNLVATFSVKNEYFLEAQRAKNNQEFEPKTAGIFIFQKKWLDQITPDIMIDIRTGEYRLEYLFEYINQQSDKISLFSIPSSEYKNINTIEDIINNK